MYSLFWLGIILRYTKDGRAIERFIEYAAVTSTTGEALCEALEAVLRKHGLDPKNCIAQNYDGAANMAGAERGLAARFNEKYGNRAPYVHCTSHDLSLVLVHASKVHTVHIMLDNLVELTIFFDYPKRQAAFERELARHNDNNIHKLTRQKLGVFCPTRWVAKFATLDNMINMFPVIKETFTSIVLQKYAVSWDPKTRAQADQLLSKLCNDTFVAVLVCTHYLYGWVVF